MTQLEFDNYKLQIQSIISKKASKIAEYKAIGKLDLGNDITNLTLLATYMDIMNLYDLELASVEDADTTNMFTRDGMQPVVTHINKICNTHYNVDFILET